VTNKERFTLILVALCGKRVFKWMWWCRWLLIHNRKKAEKENEYW